jgi:hypothetical protein
MGFGRCNTCLQAEIRLQDEDVCCDAVLVFQATHGMGWDWFGCDFIPRLQVTRDGGIGVDFSVVYTG